MKYCLKCGTELKDEAKFCDACGAKQETQVIEKAEPNELVEENKKEVIEITELPKAEKSTLSDKAKRKHKLAIIICIIAVLVVISGVITTICIVNNNRNSNQETSTVNTLTFDDAYSIYAYFKENLEFIGDYIEYDEKTDPNQKLGKDNSYIAKLNFEITYVEQSVDVTPDLGASIEIFKNNDDAKSRSDYLNNLSLTQDQGNYVCGNVLLRVTEQAKAKDMSSLKNALSEFMQSPHKYEKSSSDTNTSEYKLDSEYTLDDITFSINKDWSFNESDDNYYWYAEDNSFLYAKKNPIESSVSDTNTDFYLDQLAKGVESYADEILKTEKIKIDGTDAIKVDCMTTGVQVTLCMFILNNNTYSLSGTTDSDTIMINYFDKVINSIKINETTTTKINDTTTTEKDNTNPVVYKDKTVKITYKGIDEDDLFGTELNFTIENLSKKNIIVQARNVSINGIMVDPIFSCDVSAGKIANDEMSFLNLEDDGIDEIKTVELSFHIFDDDSWDTIVDTKTVKIRVS